MKIDDSNNDTTSSQDNVRYKERKSSSISRTSKADNNATKESDSDIGNRRHYVGGEHRSSQGHVFHDDESDSSSD